MSRRYAARGSRLCWRRLGSTEARMAEQQEGQPESHVRRRLRLAEQLAAQMRAAPTHSQSPPRQAVPPPPAPEPRATAVPPADVAPSAPAQIAPTARSSAEQP